VEPTYYITQPTHPIGKPWIDNGSEFTMKSYSNHMAAMSEHFIIIKKAPLFFNLKDCFISHAGISSYYQKHFKNGVFSDNAKIKKLLEQELLNSHGVIWTRDELINLGKLQIVGHTIVKDLYHNKKSNVLYTDTSAFAGNKLTAVIIDNNKLVESISVDTVPLDIE
jgi:serine/threonine protein phosphatase 1